MKLAAQISAYFFTRALALRTNSTSAERSALLLARLAAWQLSVLLD